MPVSNRKIAIKRRASRCDAPGSFTFFKKRKLRVLVVDDHQDTLDSWSMLMGIWGHEVKVASDGQAAIEVAADYQADVILLDIAMPDVNGFTVARNLRQQPRFKKTLLIAVTGWADATHRRLGEEAGFDHYLIKPIEPSALKMLLALESVRLLGIAR